MPSTNYFILVIFLSISSASMSVGKGQRHLYTDQIYPYPFNYINTKKYPSQPCYRETWNSPPWQARDNMIAKWMMRGFWSIFFYQLFHDPGVILGHSHLPDPSMWTDAELGIPPDEEGTYEEWVRNKYGEGHPLTPPDDGENRGGSGLHRRVEAWWNGVKEE